ncbi:hypothetical protein [Carnobacterium mobile]|uniref:hypothetical protein n=1 Tax=Carnobacterium mobile TaxID=2750 RepID=UPI001866A4CC|nr:hypothetical protein [Carnobacterium mobile]
MNLNNAEIEDFDKYIIKKGSSDTINEYSIIVDFKNKNISGSCYRYGFLDHMIDTKEAIKMLEDINKYSTPIRDFTSLIDKIKN